MKFQTYSLHIWCDEKKKKLIGHEFALLEKVTVSTKVFVSHLLEIGPDT